MLLPLSVWEASSAMTDDLRRLNVTTMSENRESEAVITGSIESLEVLECCRGSAQHHRPVTHAV